MLPSCNPCYRHATHVTVMHRPPFHVGQMCRAWAMLPASGAAGRSPCLSWAGAGRAGGRGRAASPTAGPDETSAGHRRGVSTRGRGRGRGPDDTSGGRTIPAGAGRYQRGRGPGLAGGGERSPAAPGGGKRSPAASGPLDPDLYYGVTLLFSGGGIGIDTDRTRKISIERGCYGTRHRTLSGSAAGRPRTPPAIEGSRPLSFMSWSVRRGPRAFRSGRTFGSRSIETGSPIGRPLILKEW